MTNKINIKFIIFVLSLLIVLHTTKGQELVDCETNEDCEKEINDFYTCHMD